MCVFCGESPAGRMYTAMKGRPVCCGIMLAFLGIRAGTFQGEQMAMMSTERKGSVRERQEDATAALSVNAFTDVGQITRSLFVEQRFIRAQRALRGRRTACWATGSH